MSSHRFTVQGRGHFPFDMLRYDACYPEATDDATKVGAWRPRDAEPPKRTVHLVSQVKPPTVARWQSFGWDVVVEPAIQDRR